VDRSGTEHDRRGRHGAGVEGTGVGGHGVPEPDARPLRGFFADRLAEHWRAGAPVRSDEPVSSAINRFSPRGVPPERWRRVGPLARSSVEAAGPTTVYDAGALMTVVTQHLVWLDTLGLPLTPEVAFHPDSIDRFTREGCAHLAGGTQFNYRRQLRAVGAAVLGPDAYPPPPLALKRSDPSAPYTEKEIAALSAWRRGLPTERFRHNVAVIMAFGAGAALSGQELSYLVGTEVRTDDEGVLVKVGHHRPREVPVLRRWEKQVAELAAEAGEGPVFLPERRGITRRQVPNFVARCPRGDAPPLNMVRLRATWVVHHISAGTQLRVIARAAGVDESQIVKYARYATFPDDETARRMLRDPGWR
jgi:hypothetical protein